MVWSFFGLGGATYTLKGYSIQRKIKLANRYVKDRKIVTPMGSKISQLQSLMVDIRWKPTDAARGTEREAKFRYRKNPPLSPEMFSVQSVQVTTFHVFPSTSGKVNAAASTGEAFFVPPGFFRAADLLAIVNEELNDPKVGICLMKLMDGQLAKNQSVVNLLD